MLSRLRPSTRELVNSCVGASIAVLAVTNVAVYAPTYTTVELALTVAGTSLWAFTTGHNFYRRAQAWLNDTDQTEAAVEAREPLFRGSTHSAINAKLHIAASMCFIASDLSDLALDSTTPLTPYILRIIGSSLWTGWACSNLRRAVVHERYQEEHPDQAIVRNYTADLVDHGEMMTASILYNIATYMLVPLNPIKVVYLGAWAANTANSIAQTLIERNATQVAAPIAPVTPNPGDCVIDINNLQISAEEESSTSSMNYSL